MSAFVGGWDPAYPGVPAGCLEGEYVLEGGDDVGRHALEGGERARFTAWFSKDDPRVPPGGVGVWHFLGRRGPVLPYDVARLGYRCLGYRPDPLGPVEPWRAPREGEQPVVTFYAAAPGQRSGASPRPPLSTAEVAAALTANDPLAVCVEVRSTGHAAWRIVPPGGAAPALHMGGLFNAQSEQFRKVWDALGNGHAFTLEGHEPEAPAPAARDGELGELQPIVEIMQVDIANWSSHRHTMRLHYRRAGSVDWQEAPAWLEAVPGDFQRSRERSRRAELAEERFLRARRAE